ncbi:MAG: 1-acyl-sn-glycerol-3-phosphate acyltransferase [Prolixibacteraceae bacterium]|nr:1-acyl-sn-glycerol-3-phosphate acyltransferase [Prolixibacteraceae bacterium]
MAQADSLHIFIAQLTLPAKNKTSIYPLLMNEENVTIVDRAYFIGRMAKDVSNNFYMILTLSSFLIFFVLLISYGRIELALMAFAPMFLSWIIILAGMAVLGIEFNIVNIILSTFIFGIGDDFSIFVMDGLLSEYKNGKKILAAHKTAIFFSAVTIIIGMGALIFARHPAIKSISAISLLGIISVVCIAYILQPLLFGLFISSPAKKGGMPVSLMDIIRSAYVFLCFLAGCLALGMLALVSYTLPVSAPKKRAWLLKCVHHFVRFFIALVFFVRFKTINEHGETFRRPAIIVANHQSFVDLMVALSLSPKIVIVTNKWVWNSPIFGLIIRRCGFIYSAIGYENMDAIVQERFAEGYSVLIFPEGTRSADCEINRFHKGAFYLAEKLQADIVPLLFYGNGLIISKNQPLLVSGGSQVTQILRRITPIDPAFGNGYRERTKMINAFYREQFQHLYNQYNNPQNRSVYTQFIKNYIYKGPTLEWYMRIKSRMEKRYRFFDELLPRKAFIVDIGCGYGPLDFMLKLSAKKRRIVAVDYDEEKIALARHAFSRSDMQFIHADAAMYDFPDADVFIMNDMLHYLNHDEQEKLIARCVEKLNPRGMLVIRDGDTSKKERHIRTEKTEKWSTKITNFNKSEHELCFFSSEIIRSIAQQHDLLLSEHENDKLTSNTCYILQRKS